MLIGLDTSPAGLILNQVLYYIDIVLVIKMFSKLEVFPRE